MNCISSVNQNVTDAPNEIPMPQRKDIYLLFLPTSLNAYAQFSRSTLRPSGYTRLVVSPKPLDAELLK